LGGFVLRFRVKVYRDDAQVVVAVPRAIRSPGFNPISEVCGSGVVFENFVWLWGSSDRQGGSPAVLPSSSSSGGMWSFDPFGDFPSATNNIRPTQRGAAAATHHRYGLEVEDEGLLKNLVVIFIFFGVLYIVRCFF
jgi:hypothetical protein